MAKGEVRHFLRSQQNWSQTTRTNSKKSLKAGGHWYHVKIVSTKTLSFQMQCTRITEQLKRCECMIKLRQARNRDASCREKIERCLSSYGHLSALRGQDTHFRRECIAEREVVVLLVRAHILSGIKICRSLEDRARCHRITKFIAKSICTILHGV